MLVFLCFLYDMLNWQGRLIMKTLSKLKRIYLSLFQHNHHVEDHFESLLSMIEHHKKERSRTLKLLDKSEADWYFSNMMVGMTLYTD